MEPLTSPAPKPTTTTTSPPTSLLLSLPNELLIEIGSFLPARDIFRLILTNRLLHDLVQPLLHINVPADDVLIWGASYNSIPAVLLALKHNANPNVLTINGQAALYIATTKDFPAVVDILLAHPGLDVNVAFSNYVGGRRPLGAAATMGNLDMARRLLHGGALVYQKDEMDPPIEFAVNQRDAAMVALLLETGSGWLGDEMSHANSKALMGAIARGTMTLEILDLFLKWSSEMIGTGSGLYGIAKINLKYPGYDKILAFLQHYEAPHEIVEDKEEESAEGGTGTEVPANTEVSASVPEENSGDLSEVVAATDDLDLASTPIAS